MFEQCPKRLWLSVHRPDLAEGGDADPSQVATGNEVGTIACSLLPHGAMVEVGPDLSVALAETAALLRAHPPKPIFEATLEHGGVLVRVDILDPDGRGGWRMVEVKSSTKVKSHHVPDVATQLWVATRAGVPISGVAIRHVDSSFVLRRPGEYEGLFADADVTDAARPIAAERATVAAAAREVLAGPEPTTAPGDQCEKPFPCEFSVYCHSSLPPGPEWPVTVLPNGGGRSWLERGITDLLDVAPELLTNATHKRVHQATVSGVTFHDAVTASASIAKWDHPRTWLDFETIAFAVPRWVGTRPYQQVPFQFSAHVELEDGSVEHREFLSLDGTDPRRACAEALVELVPKTGAIVGYNASFERGRILELASDFPDLAADLTAMAGRVVDLLPVARSCWYHRDQRGSWSIKAVLPTVAPEMDYAQLDVKDGHAAQAAYLEAMAPATDERRREALAAGLRKYCHRDTEAMIVLARRLSAVSGAGLEAPSEGIG